MKTKQESGKKRHKTPISNRTKRASGKAARIAVPSSKHDNRKSKPPQEQKATVVAVRRVLAQAERTAVAHRTRHKPAGPGIRSLPATGKIAAPQDRTTPIDDRPIRVFQIYHEDWHKELLDPDFEPYDDRGVQSELREFAVFEALEKSGRVTDAELWGAFSWRFPEKTGLSGADWIAAVGARKGFDVYYCNPFPQNEALYHNVWLQGEASHPRFLELVGSVFNAAGLPLEELTSIQASNSFAAGNYFVATSRFWTQYLDFVRVVLDKAERRLPARMKALLHSMAAGANDLYLGATYVPLIVERLFTTFLATGGAAFKSCRIPLPAQENALNVHVRLLREMKDVAHRTRSKWLAACWINYRNLYLNQINGREWSEDHLGNITPTALHFARTTNATDDARAASTQLTTNS